MRSRFLVSLTAALATAGTATALIPLFTGWGWYCYALAGIMAVTVPIMATQHWTTAPLTRLMCGAASLMTLVLLALLAPQWLPGVTVEQVHQTTDLDIVRTLRYEPPVPLNAEHAVLILGGVGLLALLVQVWAVALQQAGAAGMPLLLLYVLPMMTTARNTPWWVFVTGAGGYLLLLAVEKPDKPHRKLLSDGIAKPGKKANLISTGGMIAAVSVAGALFAAAMTPAELTNKSLLKQLDSASSGRAIETVHPMTRMRGYLTQSEIVELMRVRTTDTNPVYLRATTLDRFSTEGWTQSQLSADPDDQVRHWRSREIPFTNKVSATSISTRVEIKGMNDSPYLPIYPYPTSVSADGDWRWDAHTETIFNTRQNTNGLNYSFTSEHLRYTPELLNRAPDLRKNSAKLKRTERNLASNFTQVSSTTAPEITTLVTRLAAKTSSQYAAVVALQNYFSPQNGFVYSEHTAPGTSDNDVLNFLRNRQGYCEQYASTMAYLARLMKIPARVAVGFSDGSLQQDSNGDYLSLTNYDAHAWVEIYFAGLGWVPFDPTPSQGNENTSQLIETLPRPSQIPWVAAPQPNQATPEASSSTGESSQQPESNRADHSDSSMLFSWWWLGSVPILIGAAVVPSLIRIRRRRQRILAIQNGDSFTAGHAAWAEFTATAVDIGKAPIPTETHSTLVERLGGQEGLSQAAKPAMKLLATAAQYAHYAPKGSWKNHNPAQLITALATARNALLQHVPGSKRVKALLWPHSIFWRKQ